MINVSNAFKEKIRNNTKVLIKGNITFRSGESINLSGIDFLSGTVRFDDATSGSGSFDIGSAIINKFSCSLNNYDSKFDRYDFDGAVLQVYVGVTITDTTKEWIRKGIYTIDDPVSKGAAIAITALDNMYKFDRLYSDSTLAYPATLGEIVRDACSRCAVPLVSSRFDNDSYTVPVRTDDESMTYREMISYAAQIAGCYARINVDGALELRWYDFDAFEREDHLDGGRFDNYASAQYQTGDNAAGGEFDNLDPNVYITGDNYDGGTFDAMSRYHHIFKLFSQSIGTDDVVITGIKVAEDTEVAAAHMAGEAGYVLSIERNPLIREGQGQAVAEYLYAKIGGNQFRPLTVSCLSDPTIEAGDVAYVSDRKGNSYRTVITNVTYAIGSQQTLTCDAETPSAKRSSRSTAETKTLIKARQEAQKQISNYDLAVQQLTSLMTQSFGIFKTEEVKEDGSKIYYMHDKPTVAESRKIWKMTADAFAVSTDGGKTWAAGMDASGNAVVNVLSAVGINFDWARGGTVSLGGPNNGNGVMKLYDASGNVIATIDTAGFKAMHTDGSYTVLSAIGLMHVNGSNSSPYHFLTYMGSIILAANDFVMVDHDIFSNYVATKTVQLPATFKNKNISISPYFRSMKIDPDYGNPRHDYTDKPTGTLRSFGIKSTINSVAATVTLEIECTSWYTGGTWYEGGLLNAESDGTRPPISAEITFTAIA